MGVNGDTVIIPNGVTEQVQSGGVIQVQSGGAITIASGATITNNGTAVGLGRTGTVDWATTPVTATFTAANGVGYFANTSGGAFNMNLPAGTAGAIVSVADYAATWQTNNVTVVPNGSDKIGSQNENATLNVQGQSVTFVFVDSTQGWINTMDSTSNVRGVNFLNASGGTESNDGNFKIHTFTGPGTFTVNSLGSSPSDNAVDYLIVAGGASGANRSPGNANGGGGAGGFRYSAGTFCATGPGASRAAPASVPISVQGYTIVVGAGGGAVPGPDPAGSRGNAGSVSSVLGLTSAGGGGGGAGGTGGPCVGLPGGSGGGGGGGRGAPFGGSAGGTGNTPPVSPPQGSSGGLGGNTSPDEPSAGGGGAMVIGSTAAAQGPNGPGGAGAGIPTAFGANGQSCGGLRYYAGGGAGGNSGSLSGGTGGIGGGAGNNTAGTANTGGGGGGADTTNGPTSGAGGSGIVVIRYRFQ